MTVTSLFSVRTGKPEDLPFIFSSWLNSYKDSRDPAIGKVTYFEYQHALIDSLLRSCNVLVATPKDDPDTILGWAVSQADTLHYVYVKETFRRMGIGTVLAEEFDAYTHLTPYGQRALGARSATYNPYLK